MLVFGSPVFLVACLLGSRYHVRDFRHIYISVLILIPTYKLGNNISFPEIRKLSSKILNNFHRVTQPVSKGSFSVQGFLMPGPILPLYFSRLGMTIPRDNWQCIRECKKTEGHYDTSSKISTLFHMMSLKCQSYLLQCKTDMG